MSDGDDAVEITLAVVREVKLYRVPPRKGSGGVMSGEWRVADVIFTGRLRVMGVGRIAEARFEDPTTGELFAMCPIRPGELDIAVEKAADSSRNYIIRLEDKVTKRHAFLGLGFNDRSESFDFNCALSDHLRHVKAEEESEARHAEGGEEEEAALHPLGDLRLKEGETIRIEVKRPGGTSGGLAAAGAGFGAVAGGAALAGGALAPPPKLAPPPPRAGRAGPGSFPAFPPPPGPGGGASGGGGWADFGGPQGGAQPEADAAALAGWADWGSGEVPPAAPPMPASGGAEGGGSGWAAFT